MKKPGLVNRASAACKLQGNLPFPISKISWKSKHDKYMAIPPKKIPCFQTGFSLRHSRGCRTLKLFFKYFKHHPLRIVLRSLKIQLFIHSIYIDVVQCLNYVRGNFKSSLINIFVLKSEREGGKWAL